MYVYIYYDTLCISHYIPTTSPWNLAHACRLSTKSLTPLGDVHHEVLSQLLPTPQTQRAAT
jgi:hypothetical protein